MNIQLISTAIGAIVGGLLTISGTALIHWQRRRTARIRFRRLIGTELNGHIRDLELLYILTLTIRSSNEDPYMERLQLFTEKQATSYSRDEAIEKLNDIITGTDRVLSTEIYDSSIDELGLLKQEQMTYVAFYYKLVKMHQSILEGPIKEAIDSNDYAKLVHIIEEDDLDSAFFDTLDDRDVAAKSIGTSTITAFDKSYGEKKPENWSRWKKWKYSFSGYY